MDHQPQLDTANPDNFATVQGDVPNSHIPADQTAIGPSLVGNLSADSSIPDGSSIDHDALLFSQQQNDLISHADSGAAHHGLRTVGPSLNPIQPTVIDSQQHSSALESSEPVMHAAADGTFANSAAATTTSEPISVTSEAFSFQSPSPLQQQNSFDRSNPAVVPGELAIQESNTATYSNISHGTEGHQLDPTVLTPFLQRPKSRELENFNSEEDSNATAAEYGTSSEQSAAFYESTAPHGNNYEPIYASPLHATSNNAPNSRMARVLSHGKDSGRLSGTYVAAQHDSKPRSRFNTRAVCGCIFGAKLALSVLLAIAAIGVQIFWIYEMHRVAPGYVPPEPVPVFELSSPQCSTPSGGLARLEPPDGSFMFGFNLEWNKDLPSRLSQRINGIKPAIFKYCYN